MEQLFIYDHEEDIKRIEQIDGHRADGPDVPGCLRRAGHWTNACPCRVCVAGDCGETRGFASHGFRIPQRSVHLHSRVVDDNLDLDLEEQTTYRGDTIPMVLKQRNLGRYDRGLSALLYVPKGQWSFGLTVSYGNLSTKDLEIFDLLSDINIGAHAFRIRPYLQYTVRNNLAVGMRFGYYNARGNVDSFKVDIDEDMNFSLHDIGYKAESYTGAVFASQYIGLSRHGRFGIYNEIELAFGSGSSDFKRPYGGNLRTTHTTWTEAQLNFSPGVQMFIMKNVSFHISFGVFGFNVKKERQTEDGKDTGNRLSSGASFRFNLFNINFGIGVHI